MAGTDIIAIGSVTRHRGEYNASTTYYFGNQVTMCGSVFQAINSDFSGIPPLTVSEDNTVAFANKNTWKCIINNVELYNATLSANNLDVRVKKVEDNIDSIKAIASEANTTAQKAGEQSASAVLAANDAQQKVTVLESRLTTDEGRISKNEDAILALQSTISTLEITCATDGIAFEPDEDGNVALSIPIFIYDDGENVTSESEVTTLIYTPVSTGIPSSWDGHVITASAYVPGKHELQVTAEHNGKVGSLKCFFYLTLPTTVSDSPTGPSIVSKTTTRLPLSITVNKTSSAASKLLFNMPAYLECKKITCNGIDVPILIGPSQDNYTTVSTIEEVVTGTYDFIIQ